MCLFTSHWNNDYNQLLGTRPKLKKKKTKQDKTTQTNKEQKKKQGGKQVRAISIFLALKIKRLREDCPF